MALLVTIFLVLINIFNTITNVSPNVEGMTAISSWMIACIFFVFGALLGYAGLLYFLLVLTQLRPRYNALMVTKFFCLQRKKKVSIVKKRQNHFTVHAKECMLHPSSEAVKKREELASLDQSEMLTNIDTYFLYFFPVMFTVFNVIYWPYWTVL